MAGAWRALSLHVEGRGIQGYHKGTQEHAHASAAAPDRQGTRGKAAKGQARAAPGAKQNPRTPQAASAAGEGEIKSIYIIS